MLASTAAIATASIAALAALVKKLLPSRKPSPEFVPRAEFHQALDATRDRIDASHLALADKLDSCHAGLLAAIERQGATFEQRLDHLDSSLARLDERLRLRRWDGGGDGSSPPRSV